MHDCLLLPFLFSLFLEDLAIAINEEREGKCIWIGMEEVKPSQQRQIENFLLKQKQK